MSDELDEGSFIGQHFACIANEVISEDPSRKLSSCDSSDGLACYEHEGEEVWYDSHCFSCTQNFTKEETHSCSSGAELGVSPSTGKVERKKKFTYAKSKQPPMKKAEVMALIKEVGYKSGNYRGIKDEYSKFFGHLTKLNDQGKVTARYYPETVGERVTGYKCRNHPKDFRYGKIGQTGVTSDLSGQVKFNSGGKYCVPMDTKALTKRGWLLYEEVEVGDIVMGYDIKTNTKQWTKVKEKHHFTNQEVFEFGQGTLKLRATADHRWYVSQRSTGPDHSKKTHKLEVRKTKDFTTETSLVVNAPYKESYPSYETVTSLATSKYGVDWVGRVLSMTQHQRIAFLEGFLVADGYHNGSYWLGSQNDGELFEGLLMASYLVHDKVLRVKKTKPNYKGNVLKDVVLSNTQYRRRLDLSMKSKGEQDVWCITTELDSWVIRQGDGISITGNCLIVGGEEDKAAAYQMLRESQIARGQEEFAPIPVVCSTVGEGSAAKQVALQYDFCDTYDNIIIGMDNDEAGRKAAKAVCEVLPKEKVKVVTWTGKDPNKMLQLGMSKQFIRDFYGAKDFVEDTVKTSIVADSEMEEELGRAKIPLPPFMKELSHIMAGGVPLGYWVNLGAQTGGGKTTFVNEMIYYWIFNSPHKIGILSLELNAGQYQTVLLSRHIGQKIQLIEDPKEAVEFVQQEWVKEKRIELRENEYGEQRYTLLDDRDGTLVGVQLQIEKLIKKYECRMIVIDPINDLFEGVSIEEQTSFVKYLKGIIKGGISVFCICHITKGKTQLDNEGNRILRQLTEDDFAGVSNIIKSGGCNILTMRDKLAEDETERNTTSVEVAKCRWTGRSGTAGKWYYDNQKHTLYDFDTYFNT